MKSKFLLYTLCSSLVAFSVAAKEDIINVSGTACEIFNSSHSKSSVRVRVTDKASYNAVSQIPSLLELKSNMLEHDYNVIVYNLVDNYVQNMSVKTTSQDANELCVEVNGSIPSQDIVTVIANYSPSNPAPEYDFKKENNITEESAEPIKEVSESPLMYDGAKEFNVVPEPTKAEVAYEGEPSETTVEEEKTEVQPEITKTEEPDLYGEQPKALVYIAPVQFYNNTHSSKPISVLKEFFVNEDLYTLLENPDGADYTITSKVLKAKIDPINAQTKRMQMVVSVELKMKDADGSINDHQNRFVLFENGENEQVVAMNLLKKLLQKSGEKLIIRVEQNENKRPDRPFLRPGS